MVASRRREEATITITPEATKPPEAAVRAALKSQYHAALAMLRQSIELCPEAIWQADDMRNAPWQIAYHTLFFAHLYIQVDEQSFRPWSGHQADVQYPDAIPGPPKSGSTLPLTATPYTKEQALDYCSFCDRIVNDAVDAQDVFSPESGFSWYGIPKLEHQLVNVRHIQHGAAQLADRVRATADVGVDWVGARPEEE